MLFGFVLIWFFTSASICVAYNDSDLSEKQKAIEGYGVYYTLQSTLASFKEHYQIPFVKELMREISERYPDIGQVENPKKKHPFIAIEGVHRKTRNIVAVLLARRMGADIVHNPPQFMVQLGENISDVNLRKAFFGLSGYVAACSARQLTKTLPAVVTGHWLSQAAFAIAKVYDPVPPPESMVYSWPSDLYPPDIVFFINYQRKKDMKKERANPEFLPKFIKVFCNWRNPPVFEISNTYIYEEITNRMISIINREFQGNY